MPHGLFPGIFARRGGSSSPEAMVSPVVIDPLATADSADSLQADRSFEYALDALPCNAMFCDRDLILRYLNRSSRKTLLSLQAAFAFTG